MAHHTIPVGRRPRPSALRNSRGAAFLLAVYITSLAFLLLSGVALQRTNTELRAAQASRDVQQAFWLAESALDRALVDLGPNPDKPDFTVGPITSLTGTYTYQVKTVGTELVAPGFERRIRQVVATGQALAGPIGRQQTVTVTFRGRDRPFAGVAANDAITLVGASFFSAVKMHGSVRSGGGHVNTVYFYKTAIDGPVSVGEPKASEWEAAYTKLLGLWSDNNAAVTTYNSSDLSLLSQPPTKLPLTIRPWSYPAYDRLVNSTNAASVCQPGLQLAAYNSLDVYDNSPLDRDPALGHILLCNQFIVLNEGSRLTFHAPTTIYFSGGNIGTQEGTIYQDTLSKLVAMSGTTVLPNGVQLVVPTWYRTPLPYAEGPWKGEMIFSAGSDFKGSVWAPDHAVYFQRGSTLAPSKSFQAGSIIANWIRLDGFFSDNQDWSFLTSTSSSTTQSSNRVVPLTWTN